ncbi:hypothetical protein SEVIR_6G080575v4 [Setaria viridis]
MSRGSITVDRNCSALGAPQNLRPSFGGYPFLTNLDLVQKGLAVVFNFLARFGSSPTYCLPLRRPPGRDPNARTDEHLGSSSANSTQIPIRLPHQSVQFAAFRVSPGPIPAGIRDKAPVFLRLLLSFAPPAPGPLFLFDSAGRSGPLLLFLIVFSRRKARSWEGVDRGFGSGGVDLIPR